MTPERWRRVGELFHESFEVATSERTRWMGAIAEADPELGRELISLLDSDRRAAQGFVEGTLKATVLSYSQKDVEAQRLQPVGPYRLVRELGRGGMGTVYLAERDDNQYRTQAAIKLVRPGMDTEFILRRFRQERQTLAHLQHPNIARLLDGGTTESGLPYIVMEYIDGVWITDYCQDHELSIDRRVTLFLDVCSAVEYAHRQFVVHRDIKPGNILVDKSGAAKLLDFGICKLLQTDSVATRENRAETVAGGMRMLTPDYASPEQIAGDQVTVASDVYSLGAVLYELLTGAKAHQLEKLTAQGIERAICEQDPVRPSAAASGVAARRLRGDLDNILLRALQKEPGRRYASTEQFAEDLRRYLTHLPVKARPDTLLYRLRKFARRQRGTVAAAAAVAASLTAGTVMSLREARTANQNLLQVRRLANTFVFEVNDAVRDLPGSIRARQLIVGTGLQYLDRLAANSDGDAELRGELAAAYQRIGDIQGDVNTANLGNTAGALDSYRRALALLDSVRRRGRDAATAQLSRMTLHQRIGGIQRYTLNNKQALVSYREAEREGEALRARDPGNDGVRRQLADVRLNIGSVLRVTGEHAASLEENSQAMALLAESLATHPDDRSLQLMMANAREYTGMTEIRLGRLQAGLDHYQEAVTQLEQLVGLDPGNASYQHELMLAYGHLGDATGSQLMPSLGNTEGAIAAYRKLLAIARRLYQADPADQRLANDYGVALSRVAGALPPYQLAREIAMPRESVRVLQEVTRNNPNNLPNRTDLAYSLVLLGDTLAAAGDQTGSSGFYREGMRMAETAVKSGQRAPSITLMEAGRKLAEAEAKRGDRGASLHYAQSAFEAGEPSTAAAKARPASQQRFLTPRAFAAKGLTYAALLRGDTAGSPLFYADREEAERWLHASLEAWQAVRPDPAFAANHLHEMRRVEAALAETEKRK